MAFSCSSYINIDKSDDSNNPKNAELNEKEINKNPLNFYESMYHFKKMFPKFESDVIEQILRANNGAVDKTIDQLLLMASDYDSFVHEKKVVDIAPISIASTIQIVEASQFTQDLPPSYNEFMSSISKTESEIDEIQSNVSVISAISPIEKLSSKKIINLIDDTVSDNIIRNSDLCESKLIEENVDSQKLTKQKCYDRNNIMIGELSKDFLRIKLTTEQVKKMKTTIKKAKRGEIAAIANEKSPEEPEEKPISQEIKTKLSMLNNEEIPKNECEQFKDRKTNYDTYQKYEKNRAQIIQDEYMAKVMQNEEFLTELKQNNDFMQTLDSELTSKNEEKLYSPVRKNSLEQTQFHPNDNVSLWEDGKNHKNYSISNAELQKKLIKMGKNTRRKFIKLATAFTKKARQQCNKTVEQVTIAYSNIFASQLNSIEYYNNSYILQNNNTFNQERSHNRYQRAYKSFKTAIKRNPKMPDNGSPLSKIEDDNMVKKQEKYSNPLSFYEDYSYDRLEQLPKIESFKNKLDNDKSTGSNSSNSYSYMPELSLFDDSYSYDDNYNGSKEYTYDHSVYPRTKIFTNNSTISKKSSSKKIPERFNSEERTFK